jgi:hypothetical protein
MITMLRNLAGISFASASDRFCEMYGPINKTCLNGALSPTLFDAEYLRGRIWPAGSMTRGGRLVYAPEYKASLQSSLDSPCRKLHRFLARKPD